MHDEYRVYVEDLTKTFGMTKALNSVTMGIKPGEIHAIVGENGAGKSTLIKILSGVVKADKGNIYIDGRPVEIGNPKDAMIYGIATVFQEPMVFPELSVYENIFIGNRMMNKFGVIDNRKELKEARAVLNRVKLSSHYSKTLMKDLSIANQQLVLIAKALIHKAQIFIFDEPTAILSKGETDILFDIIRSLSQKNISVIYISHRMEEIFEISDTVTIFRNGNLIDTITTKKAALQDLVKKISGSSRSDKWNAKVEKVKNEKKKNREIVLNVKNISGEGFKNINFCLYKGEVLGFFGLVGAGRTEIMESLVGIRKFSSGSIFLKEKKIKIRGVHESVKYGLAYLPEDRSTEGLYLKKSIFFNGIMPVLDRYSNKGFFKKNRASEDVEKLFKELKIKAPSASTLVESLSGGNQQKALFLKYMNTDPNIFIMDEPTRGVDITTKNEIYKLIKELKKNGIPVIVVSSDLEELLGIADRLIVMHEGLIFKEFDRDDFKKEEIMNAAFGLKKSEGSKEDENRI